MGKNKFLAVVGLSLLAMVIINSGLAADRLKFGTSWKEAPQYYLPFFAAQEQGFWKQNEIEAEYLPFRGGGALYQAVAAREINIGYSGTISQIHSASSGVPILIISELSSRGVFSVWVLSDSPLKEPKDLKGARVGVGRTGSMDHLYGVALAKSLGMEKEVKFVAVGGLPEQIASMKTRATEGYMGELVSMAQMKVAGEVRELISTTDYLPKEWMEHSVFVHKEFARSKPDVARRVVRAVLQAVSFIRTNPRWALGKMKSESGYSEEVSTLIYEKGLWFTRDGKFQTKAVENVRNFLIEYGLVPKDKTLPVDQLYSLEFTK